MKGKWMIWICALFMIVLSSSAVADTCDFFDDYSDSTVTNAYTDTNWDSINESYPYAQFNNGGSNTNWDTNSTQHVEFMVRHQPGTDTDNRMHLNLRTGTTNRYQYNIVGASETTWVIKLYCYGSGSNLLSIDSGVSDENYEWVKVRYEKNSTTWSAFLNDVLLDTQTNGNCGSSFDDIYRPSTPSPYGQIQFTNFSMWSGSGDTNPCLSDGGGGEPPAGDTLNITASSPDNNSQFNTQSLSANFTVDSSNSFNCSLYLNGGLNATQTGLGAGSGVLSQFNLSFASDLEDSFSYYAECGDGTTWENSTTKNFYIDNTNPTLSTNLEGNGTVWTYWHNLSVNASDTYLYSVLINDSCGYNYYNNSLSSPFSHEPSINVSSCSLGTQYANVTVCDGNGAALNCLTSRYSWENQGRLAITASSRLTGSAINNFTVFKDGVEIGSTTSGAYNLDGLATGTFNITIEPAGFASGSSIANITGAYHLLSFDLYTMNSINFTFYNEKNLSVIDTTNISVEFIGDAISYAFNTSNGTLYVDLLTPSNYTIRYSADGFGQRHYFFTLTNKSYNQLNMYMLDNLTGEDLIVTVYDQTTLNTIENALVYLQRYYPSTNDYRTVAMYQTDVAGKAYLDVQFEDEYYKFLVDYPWKTTKLITEELYIEASTINLYINTLEEVADTFFKEEDITFSINYDSGTNTFSTSWVDTDNLASEYCFYLKKYGEFGKETINSSCSSSNSGSITLGGMDENVTYYGVLTANINGDARVLGSGWKELVGDNLNSGVSGIFYTIIFFVMGVFLAAVHVLALIFGAVILVFAKMLGFLDLISWGAVFTIVVSTIVLALIIQMKRR